ncbi:MAG TPA: hypothetical protein VGI81_07120 [Tepidisphaeraceae bacterium]|jgi:hypothetical protein
MSDDGQKPKKRSLSEISHLFLSNVRDRQTDGAQPPQRTPPPQQAAQWTPPQPAPQPPRTDESIDLTPEEFARMYGGGAGAQPAPSAEPRRKAVPVAAIIGAHLNGKQFDYVKRYARHRAAAVGRVGLIELDASELRLMCFDPAGGSPAAGHEPDLPPECAEPRQMSEALEEMNWDVEQWLVLLPNPRTPEARALLRAIDRWVLLCTSDHDGVVASYRMLKGLAEAVRPRLALSVLDAADEAQDARVFQKLSGVCQQFLDWRLDAEPAVRPVERVSEHLVLLYRPTRDKAQLAAAPQWGVVAEFIDRAKAALEEAAVAPVDEQTMEQQGMRDPSVLEEARALIADVVVPNEPRTPDVPLEAAPVQPTVESPVVRAPASHHDDSIVEVIDLPGADASNQTILAAVLRKAGNALIECPLRPPMCVEARLAVGRDRGLVLVVAASQGLGELRSIAAAYRWLAENRELIGMAVPQFSIDSRRLPSLRLLVDRADLAAESLRTMLDAEHVTIQAYRKLRWGHRLGIVLEAA